MTATLYCFGESGNAYKAALTMALAGYDWTPVWVDFFVITSYSIHYTKLYETSARAVMRWRGVAARI